MEPMTTLVKLKAVPFGDDFVNVLPDLYFRSIIIFEMGSVGQIGNIRTQRLIFTSTDPTI